MSIIDYIFIGVICAVFIWIGYIWWTSDSDYNEWGS